jgi:acetyl/propionyl-CoA carboxylase alpha subunit
LVELQLRVAAGERLPDLSSVPRRGHSIEARIYAEDPSKGFLPRPGLISELRWSEDGGEPQTASLRIESGIRAGDQVTPFYDPMLAKVVAWGHDRAVAIERLKRALAEAIIGPCTTNQSFLRRILDDPEFRAGRYDTGFAEALARAG